MVQILRLRLLLLLPVGTGLLLASCCANNVCDTREGQDAIRFRFSADTTSTGNGFRKADLDTLIVQRFPLPFNPASTRFETVTLFRAGATARDSVLTLDNATPFSQVGNLRLNSYRYVVQYLAHPNNQAGQPALKGVPTTVLTVDFVQLKGTYTTEGCCSYYENLEKKLYRDGNPTPIDLERNNVVVLTKP